MKRFLFVLMASLVMSLTGFIGTSTASANSFDSLHKSARNYLGVPYKYAGSTAAGFDCSGYTQVVFKENGISIPRATGGQYNTGTPVAKSNLQPGDLVFFNTTGKGVSHVGIYIGNSNFIHASTSQGVMVSSINERAYWGPRYIGAKRVANFNASNVQATADAVTSNKYPTRSDVAKILANELGIAGDSGTTPFVDVSINHPQLPEINAVTAAGIFSGSNGKFNPDDNLTRAQMAKVLVESFNLSAQSDVIFNDVSPNNWAHPYVQTLSALDITQGLGNGDFGANDKVTKKQLEVFIERIKNLN